MSKEIRSVEAYASDMWMPSSFAYEPLYTTSPADGVKNSDRYVPVSSRITNDQSAISPSMNDQWSGKTFFIRTRAPLAPLTLSSTHPPTPFSGGGVFTAAPPLPPPPSPGRPRGGGSSRAPTHRPAAACDGRAGGARAP